MSDPLKPFCDNYERLLASSEYNLFDEHPAFVSGLLNFLKEAAHGHLMPELEALRVAANMLIVAEIDGTDAALMWKLQN